MSAAEIFSMFFDCDEIGYPDDIDSAIDGIFRFYRRQDEPLPNETDADESSPIPWDFERDADSIYSAFRREYGIDLADAKIHWWRFMALLEGLYSYSFRDRVGYRVMDVSKVPQSQRSDAIRKRSMFAIHRGEESLEDHIEMLRRIAAKNNPDD